MKTIKKQISCTIERSLVKENLSEQDEQCTISYGIKSVFVQRIVNINQFETMSEIDAILSEEEKVKYINKVLNEYNMQRERDLLRDSCYKIQSTRAANDKLRALITLNER